MSRSITIYIYELNSMRGRSNWRKILEILARNKFPIKESLLYSLEPDYDNFAWQIEYLARENSYKKYSITVSPILKG